MLEDKNTISYMYNFKLLNIPCCLINVYVFM